MSGLSTLTVTGAAGVVQTFEFQNFQTPARYAAADILSSLNSSVIGGTLFPIAAGSGTAVPAGKVGLLQVGVGGQFSIENGYQALIDNATTPTTVFGGSIDGQMVVAAGGALNFTAGLGAGTVVAGTDNNVINVLRGAGRQYIATGAGADTIIAAFGSSTVSAGAGKNFILAQGGDNSVISSGDDLISAPDGNAAVTLRGQDQDGLTSTLSRAVFLGSGNSQVTDIGTRAANLSVIVVGSGASTISSAGADQIWMQGGGGLVRSYGISEVTLITGGSSSTPAITTSAFSADTVIGGTGAVSVIASKANDFVFAGPGALNFVGGQGASTILGNAAGTASITGGAGSVIAVAYGTTNFTGGSGAATVAAFGGGVTINGGTGTGLFLGSPDGNSRISAGTGRATMFGGGDGDVLTAGSAGLGVLVAGRGAETLVGGAGADLFAVVRGTASNAVVQNFTKGQDFITFTGFSAPEVASALSSAGLVGGSQQLTLADGTKILFAGITGLSAGNIL